MSLLFFSYPNCLAAIHLFLLPGLLKPLYYPTWLAQLVGASSCIPKVCQFDSQSGHIYKATDKCFSRTLNSLFLFLSLLPLPPQLPLSLKINKHILGWGFFLKTHSTTTPIKTSLKTHSSFWGKLKHYSSRKVFLVLSLPPSTEEWLVC